MMVPKPKQVTPSNSTEMIPDSKPSNDADTSFEIDEPDEDDFVFIGSFNEKPVVVSSSRNNKVGKSSSNTSTNFASSSNSKGNDQVPLETFDVKLVSVKEREGGGPGGSGGEGGGGATFTENDVAMGPRPDLKKFQCNNDIDSDSPDSSVLLSGSSTPTTADVADLTLNNHDGPAATVAMHIYTNKAQEHSKNLKISPPSTVISMQHRHHHNDHQEDQHQCFANHSPNNNTYHNNNTNNNNNSNNNNSNMNNINNTLSNKGSSSNSNTNSSNYNNNYNNEDSNNSLTPLHGSSNMPPVTPTTIPAAALATTNSASIADDNLSSSIATTVTTTTTEIDIDNITIATSTNSPNLIQNLATPTPPPSNNAMIGAFKRNNGERNKNKSSNDGVANDDGDASDDSENSSIVNIFSSMNVPPSNNDMLHSSYNLGKKPSSTSGHKRTQSSTSQVSQKSQLPQVDSLKPQQQIWRYMCSRFKSIGIGKPSVYHAMIVIFLEYFAWGLLTMPVIQNLKQIFPHHTFLMNGMLLGIKGLLSFLSAPLVGALSDIWGRKIFFLVTVFFTCSPIPLLTLNLSWFFAMISISGIFAVTFSVVFAYVADVTTVEERSKAYGLVSATFAASLVISPALGNVLMNSYGDAFVVAICIAIAVLDIFFILVAVPESLPEKIRPSSWGAPINWEQADPFAALRKVGSNKTVMMQCVTVLLSNLPEAGQYSSIFVYLKWKIGFNTLEVSIFIAFVGILSITVQVTLGFFMRVFGAKSTIIIGLTFEMIQMLWFGLANEPWMMWGAGLLAALGSIAYPAISAFVSIHSNADSQGAVQGMLTGVRGLCNGLGPAVFGVIFYFFDVDMDETTTKIDGDVVVTPDRTKLIPGPPFLFGAVMVVIAICVAVFIPETPHAEDNASSFSRTSSDKKHVQYEIESGRKLSTTMLDARAPLMRSESMAQL